MTNRAAAVSLPPPETVVTVLLSERLTKEVLGVAYEAMLQGRHERFAGFESF